MDREALRQRLMLTFLGELEDHVQTMTRDLLTLEKGDDRTRRERITSLFRTAHSLKGAARSVNLLRIEKACHALETLFAKHSHLLQQQDEGTIQLLYRASDVLKETGARLRNGSPDAEQPIDALLPALRRLAIHDSDVTEPPPASEAPPPITSPPPAPPPRDPTVRVAADKLDALLTASGELLVARKRAGTGSESAAQLRDELRQWRSKWVQSETPIRRIIASHPGVVSSRLIAVLAGTGARLHALERQAEHLASTLVSERRGLDRAAEDLDDVIRRVRMYPLSDAWADLERMVRDLAHDGGTRALLSIRGGEIEVGRLVLDGLRDPLMHLIRNAMAHGIETPKERVAAGKPETGSITITASLRGSEVEIVVADDGRGLDIAAIREHARRQGISPPPNDRDTAGLVFLPGFTTALSITKLSGRGMGMEIVRDRLRAIHGRAEVTSEAGQGTRVMLSVPLTLMRIRALQVAAGGQVYALPLTSVIRLARVSRTDLASIGGRQVLLSNNAPIPVVRLIELLGGSTTPPSSASKIPVVVVSAGTGTIALAVDELIAEEDILVKTLGERLRRIRHFAGGTILASGRVALILNAADLVRSAGAARTVSSLASLLEPAAVTPRRILVVDDSITTRSLEKSILEASGYAVDVAADGAEGWKLLQERGADLVVADVEMPKMSGFALCETIRASVRFRRLPVVLVTGLSSDADKARGLAAGADAYLLKSAFDQQQLLDTLSRLL